MGVLSRAAGYTGPPVAATGASTAIPAWVDTQAQANLAGDSPYEDDQEGGLSPNPLRFLGNVVGDVTDIAKGLGGLVGLVGSDIYHGIGDLVEEVSPLDDTDNDYYSDDIVQSLIYDPDRSSKGGLGGVWEDAFGGIKDDIVDRYVKPYQEEGVKGVLTSLYEDPVFAAADVATLGTLGGSAVAASAKAAMKAPGVMDELAKVGAIEKELHMAQGISEGVNFVVDVNKVNELVARHADAMASLSPQAAFVKKTLPGAGKPALATGEKIPLGDVKTVLTSEAGGIRATTLRRSSNPVRRWAKDKLDTALSTPVDRFVEKSIAPTAAEMVGTVKGGLTRGGKIPIPDQTGLNKAMQKFGSEYGEELRLVQAAHRYGLDRLEYRPITRFRAQQAFDKLAGMYTTRFYGVRDEYIQLLTDTFNKWQKSGADVDNFAARAVIDTAQNDIGSFTPEELSLFVREMAADGRHAAPDLAPEEWSRIEENVSNGAVQREEGIIDLGGDWGLAEKEMQGIARVLGDPTEVARVGNKIVSATFSPPGRSPVRFRFLTGNSRMMADALEDIMSSRHTWDNLAFELTEELATLKAQRMGSAMEGVGDDVAQAKVAASLDKQIAVVEMKLRQAQNEVEAYGALAEDLSVFGRIDMHDGPVNPDLGLHAELLVRRHNMTVAPARKAGQLTSAVGMMERSFLPMKLEFMAHREGKIMPLYEKLRGLLDKPKKTPNVKRAIQNTMDELVRLGFAKADDSPNVILARIMRDIMHKPESKDFAFDTDAIKGMLDGPPMWKQMREVYKEAGRMTPVYFPYIDPRLMKPSDWLMQKAPVFGRLLGKGKAPFKRAMGHLYVNGSYVTDPVDAYARRAAQVRKYLDMEAMHQELIDTFGRPITHLDDIGPHEALMAPELLRRFLRTRTEIEEKMAEGLMQGMSEGEAFAEAFGKAFAKLEKDGHIDLDKFGREVFGDKWGKDINASTVLDADAPAIYAVPKAVAQRMDAMAKFHLGWKARIIWDAPLNVWRTLILAFSPRWITNNLLGNVTFLKLQGGNFNDAIRLMGGKTARKFARSMGNEEWSPAFLKRVENMMDNLPPSVRMGVAGGFFSSTQQQISHFGAAEGTAAAMLFKGIQAQKIAKPFASASAKMRRLNESIEESFRQASFLKAVDKELIETNVKRVGKSWITSDNTLRHIAEKGLDEQTALKALDEVNYFFNDYMRLGPYERNLIRRYIMPFYSFYKHTVKLLTSYPFHSPVRYQVIETLGEISKEMASEFGALPDWLVGSVPIGQKGEDTMFLNTRGANPFSGLVEGPRGLLSGLAPQVRTAIEYGTGEDIVTGKPFTSPETFVPFGGNQAFRVDPETLNVDPTSVRPGLGELIGGQFPQYELIRDIIDKVAGRPVGARYSTGETMIDPATGEAVFPEDMGVTTGNLAGVSRTPFNQQGYIERLSEDERAALIGYLRRAGIIPMPVEEAQV